MKSLQPRLLALLAVLALFVAVQTSSAQTTRTWTGADALASVSTNWSSGNNWQGGSAPTPGNSILFNATAAASGSPFSALGSGPGGIVNPANINNIVDANIATSTLTYTNANGKYHNTLINPGLTLSITNSGTNFLVGWPAALGNIQNYVTIAGTTSTLSVSNTNATVFVALGLSGSGNSQVATLDLSGLGAFNATINRFWVGVGANRMCGVAYLAQTNIITASGATVTGAPVAFDIGEDQSNPAPFTSSLYLGQTNAILADGIATGNQKNLGSISFNSAFSSPSAYFRGKDGTSAVGTWSIGNGNTNSGTSTCTGANDFTGGSVDALVNTMYVGRASAQTSGSGTSSGTLTFDKGVFNVGTLYAGYQPSSGNRNGNGTVNVNGAGLLAVGTLNLGISAGGVGAVSTAGTLTIGGGTVRAGTITAGTYSTINLNSGVLTVTNTAGTVAAPIAALNLIGGTLQVPAVVGGAASVVVQSLTLNGSADTIDITAVPATSVFPAQFALIKYAAPYSGTFDFNLGILPAPYQGYLSNNTANASVDLVLTGNAGVQPFIWKGNVNGDWDTSTTNWLYGGTATNYQQGGSVQFDDTLTGTTNVNLAAALSPSLMRVVNVAKSYVFSGSGKLSGSGGLSKDGSGSLKLTETGGDDLSGGIAVNNGTIVLDNANSAISGGLIINGGTVQIGNNDANGALPSGTVLNNGSLVFYQTSSSVVGAAISGTGSLTQKGSGTLSLSAASPYSGNTMVSAGTLALTGAGSITNSAVVVVSNATLDVSAVTGSTALNSLKLTNATVAVSVGANYQANFNVSSLTMGGTGSTINVGSLPSFPKYPVTVTLLRSASAISGYNFVLGSLPPASPAYVGSIAQSGDNKSVLFTLTSGPVGARSSYVSWTGVDALANVNTNWSDDLNWQSPLSPAPSDNVLFDGTAAAAGTPFSAVGSGPGGIMNPANINNIVNANFTVGTLTYANVNGLYQNTLINPGLTLSITNNGPANAGSLLAGWPSTLGNVQNYVTIAGTTGTLNVSNTNAAVFVALGLSGSGNSQVATLDLSGLGTFNAAIDRFWVGVGANRMCGVAYLARTNVITASRTTATGAPVAFDIGEDQSNPAPFTCSLYLGQTNAILTDGIGTGNQKNVGSISFNSAFSNPSAYFRGKDGTSAVGTWSIGNGNTNEATATCTGVDDFTGGSVDALVDTMYVGRASAHTGTGLGMATGTLTFDKGLVTVGMLYAGYQPTSGNRNGVGTVNVNGTGLLAVGALNLGIAAGGAGAASTAGTLTIGGGAVRAGTITAGASSIINLNGGVLSVTNTAGTPAAPLAALNLTGGTLQLSADGNATAASLVATAITTSGTTIVNIGSIVNIYAPATNALISYTGTDPYGSLTLGTVPAGYAATLADNVANSSIDLHITSVPSVTHPVMTSITLSGANLTISGTNGVSGASYRVFGSTNVALPLATWTPIATNTFSAATFTFTITVDTNAPNSFYSLSVP